MRVLVTGGAGYIGSVVGLRLVEAGHDVTVLDDLSTGHADAVPPGAEFIQLGIARATQLLTERPPYDAVMHLAGRSLVAESMMHPEQYWRANVMDTLLLLDAMRMTAVSRLIFSSTGSIYGEPDEVPIVESAPARPSNTYASSKLATDLMLTGEATAHGLAAVSLRYFNAAGAVGRFGERHANETHLIPIALEVALGKRSVLAVHGNDYPTPDGTCIRDYVHIDDIAQAHLLALEAATPGEHQIYNLGTGAGFSVLEVIDAVRAITKHPIPLAVGARRLGDPATLVASSERIRDELGWKPNHTNLDTIVADAWQFMVQRN